MSFNQLKKKILLGNSSHIPKIVCCGHKTPETQVRVQLNTSNKKDAACNKIHGTDVTCNHVMVELRPLLLGIMFSRDEAPLLKHYPDSFYLSMHDPEHVDTPGFCFGEIGLKYYDTLEVNEHCFVLFITTFCKNYCLSPLRLQGHYLHERLFLLFDRDPHNYHKMKPYYLFSNWLLYSLPRSVALVSFDDGENSNMYPMDLIGPTASPYYILSFTSVYPSIPFILRDKRLAVSQMPLDQTDIVYAMGKNNKKLSIPRDELIIETKLSPNFSIPVPDSAITVRELDIVVSFEVCYHTVIVARTHHYERYNNGTHFCHINRIYQRYLMDQGRALPHVIRQYNRPEGT